jgi:hypothetical protein
MAGASRYPKCFLSALSAGFLLVSFVNAAIPSGYTGKPYPSGSAPRELNGRINFKDYDLGGLNVSFYADDKAGDGTAQGSTAAGRDNDGDASHPAFWATYDNPGDLDSLYLNGTSYPHGVRYPSATDTSIHDYYIGASHPNSWNKWTVHVSKAGKYWISSIWAASNSSIDFTISFLNGTNVTKTPTIHFDNNSYVSYHSWRPFNDFVSVQLDSGVQVMYFQNASYHLNQDFLFFAADSGQFTTALEHPVSKAIDKSHLGLSISKGLITFSIPDAGMTKVSIFDCLGREIAKILDRNLNAGAHTSAFSEAALRQGVYFMHVTHNAATAVQRFEVLAK